MVGALTMADEVFNAHGVPVPIVTMNEPALVADAYRVMLTDGRSLVTGADHLWKVFQRNMNYIQRLRSVRQLLATPISYTYKKNGPNGPRPAYRWQIEGQKGIYYFPAADLPLDPYIFGYWLGDGSSKSALMIVGADDADFLRAHISRAGMFIISDAVATRQPNVRLIRFSTSPMKGTNTSDSAVRRLRLMGVLENKHIPDIYLASSFDQRLALLRGLMDSDGSPSKGIPKSEFSSTNQRLAQGVTTLARSLGFLPRIREGEARLDGRYISQRWRVNFNPTADDPNPYLLERKARLVHRSTVRKRPSIRSIENEPNCWIRQFTIEGTVGIILAGSDLVPIHMG